MWNIQTFSELPSTQTLARKRLDDGTARHGDVIVALHQSEGRGQYNWRLWHDEPGANLLLSIILTDVVSAIVPLMQFVTGLSVLATIRSLLEKGIHAFDAERVKLKWPNDILLDGKKISGILSEALWNGSTLKGIILGVGININQELFAQPVVARAISLKTVLNYTLPIEETRDLFLATLQYTLRKYVEPANLLTDLRNELHWMNSLPTVRMTLPNGSLFTEATIKGITDSGALHILSGDGVEHFVQTATITLEE